MPPREPYTDFLSDLLRDGTSPQKELVYSWHVCHTSLCSDCKNCVMTNIISDLNVVIITVVLVCLLTTVFTLSHFIIANVYICILEDVGIDWGLEISCNL